MVRLDHDPSCVRQGLMLYVYLIGCASFCSINNARVFILWHGMGQVKLPSPLKGSQALV